MFIIEIKNEIPYSLSSTSIYCINNKYSRLQKQLTDIVFRLQPEIFNLYVETANKNGASTVYEADKIGRRFVDISYLLKSIAGLNNHSQFNCGFSDMDIVGESKNGLISCFQLKCRLCGTDKTLFTEDPSLSTELNLNSAAVLASISTGCGHTQMVEQLAILNIPQMSYRKYSTHHDLVSESIYKAVWDAMEEAGKEELALAREVGETDKDGNGLITVIVDGAWSKRSYKVNYDALSGVVSIPYPI